MLLIRGTESKPVVFEQVSEQHMTTGATDSGVYIEDDIKAVTKKFEEEAAASRIAEAEARKAWKFEYATELREERERTAAYVQKLQGDFVELKKPQSSGRWKRALI
jgi:hypothetical protein